MFFIVPLYLSVVLQYSAIETGPRIMPLSVALLIAAAGIPKLLPRVSPRLVTRCGLVLMLLGILALLNSINKSAAVVTVPLLLIGLGIGALGSQLGAVTVSAVPNHVALAVVVNAGERATGAPSAGR